MNVRNKLDETKIKKRAYINGEYVWAESGEVIKKTSSIDGSDLSGIAACDDYLDEELNHLQRNR